jgi:hypothetical protein
VFLHRTQAIVESTSEEDLGPEKTNGTKRKIKSHFSARQICKSEKGSAALLGSEFRLRVRLKEACILRHFGISCNKRYRFVARGGLIDRRAQIERSTSRYSGTIRVKPLSKRITRNGCEHYSGKGRVLTGSNPVDHPTGKSVEVTPLCRTYGNAPSVVIKLPDS